MAPFFAGPNRPIGAPLRKMGRLQRVSAEAWTGSEAVQHTVPPLFRRDSALQSDPHKPCPTPRLGSALMGRGGEKGSPMSGLSGSQQFIRQVNDAIYGV